MMKLIHTLKIVALRMIFFLKRRKGIKPSSMFQIFFQIAQIYKIINRFSYGKNVFAKK